MLNVRLIIRYIILPIILFMVFIYSGCTTDPGTDYKTVVHTFNQAWNTGEYELLNQTVHPDYYKQEGEMEIKGVDPLIEYVKNWRYSLPDAKIIYVEEIYGKEKAAIRFTLEGTPVDTGKKFKAEGIVIFKFKDGKIIEDKSVFDQLTMFTQQGYTVVPPKDNN